MVIDLSLFHQTTSPTLLLSPRRGVEVYLWGHNQLIHPPTHSLEVTLSYTLGLRVGPGSCSLRRGR